MDLAIDICKISVSKPNRFVDVVLTILWGTLFPMCGMNLAFSRELIGPAMYFGLMGIGEPIGRYGDMWAGWCMKVNKEQQSWSPADGGRPATDGGSGWLPDFGGGG